MAEFYLDLLIKYARDNENRFREQLGATKVIPFGNGYEPTPKDLKDLGEILAKHLAELGTVVVLTNPSYVSHHVRRGINYPYGVENVIPRNLVLDGLAGKIEVRTSFTLRVKDIGRVGVLQVTRTE